MRSYGAKNGCTVLAWSSKGRMRRIMNQRMTLRTLAFGILLSGSLISIGGVAHADCPAGFQNNADTNVSTGVTVYFCTPLGEQDIAKYDSNITPNAPVATPEIAPELVPTLDAVVAPLSAELLAPADPNDPFPDLVFGETLPGTLVDGDVAISCPDGAGRGIDFNVATLAYQSYCVKTYVTPDPSLVADPVPTDSTLSVDVPVTDVSVTAPADITPLKVGGLAGTSARGD